MPEIDKSNTQLLFENCTKLTDIVICSVYPSIYFMTHIKENCLQIKSIGLLCHPDHPDPEYERELRKLLPKTTIKIFEVKPIFSDLCVIQKTKDLFF